MSTDQRFRNYRLSAEAGGAPFRIDDWYRCPVPRKRLKALMRRSDRPALRDYGLWLALLAGSGALATLSWGSWLAVPALLVYGVLYASAAESRFHECLHRTPFRTRWLNELCLHVTGFMALKNSLLWRWSHTRHHSETVVVGRDPEIAYPRPPDLWGMALNLLHLRAGPTELKKTLRHAVGVMTDGERSFVPEGERPTVVRVARIHLAILALTGLAAILSQSWLPVLFVGLPTFYGSWLHHAMSAMQHAGLAEDVPDHRLNSRTVILNPVLAFIYSNMNYHLEHHMFPMVPSYALPALHEAIKGDCPPPYRGVIAAYREILPALWKQQRDPGYFVPRPLPAGAGATPDVTLAAA